ncbi:MAG: porin [Planctomycetes bacterium]|nr:porin [Planctomycetota bacterium]
MFRAVTVAAAAFFVAMVGTADAQNFANYVPQSPQVRQVDFEYNDYTAFAQDDPVGGSASDRAAPVIESPSACGGCGTCMPARGGCGNCGGEAWTLRQPKALKCRGIEIGGWIDSGVSVVANNPADRYNGVVTFNDRDGEYQMNQFWLFAEKAIDNGGCGWAIGGRVDFVYGTDARFTQAADGLERNWNQTERFYQAALPQFYVDVAYNNLTIRTGHFYTIIGYEVVQAPDNFFYSHAYTMQYGEPFTHTGVLGIYDLSDRVTVTGGVHRGNDQFDDTDGLDALGFLGGVSLNSCDKKKSLAFALSASEDGPGISTTIYSVVGTWKPGRRFTYVLQHDYGQTWDGGRRTLSEWYGLNQYFLYQINNCWSAGVRAEVFRDNNGTRVAGLGDGNLNAGPFIGNFYEVTAGLNWTPHPNITVRPEARWDWFDADQAGGPGAYDAGDRNSQFLFGCDLIVTY